MFVLFALVGRTAAILDVAMLCPMQNTENKGITLILLAVPATNAVSKRSASALTSLKTGIFEQLCRKKKIESLHDSPRSRGNDHDWLIEHGRHWKSVCFNIKWQAKSLWKIRCQLKNFSNHVLNDS